MNDRKPCAWVRKNARTKNLHPSKQKWEVIYEDPHANPPFKQRTKGGFRTKKAAEDWANDWTDPTNPHVDPLKSSEPFESVASEYLGSRHFPKANTRASLEQILLKSSAPTGLPENYGGKPVGEISYEAVLRWLADFSGKRNATTVRNTFYAFRTVLDYAVDTGRIKVNPARMGELANPKRRLPKVKKMHIAEEERYQLTAGEAETVLSFMPYPFNLYALTAVKSAARPEEVAGFVVNNYTDDGTLKVRGVVVTVNGELIREEYAKNASSRREIPLDTDSAGQLDEYLQLHIARARLWYAEHRPDEALDLGKLPLFVGLKTGRANKKGILERLDYSKPIRHSLVVAKYFKPALKAAGLPSSVRFYDLRHARISQLVDAIGQPDALTLKEVQDLAGHASSVMTLDRYAHTKRPDVARSRKALDGLTGTAPATKVRRLRSVSDAG
ncbi:Arm DNA-binding domain-containing protein [Kribbella italica]|uniref:Integrase n=1 Tax=Kribbella italica TaxID=1540520 RepID=A0A7W9J8U7_9ACTN|nr:tyrosine-type recombinase/integrase [Kribbella italica]MBB5837741.1 integrase [Kribbella italica]